MNCPTCGKPESECQCTAVRMWLDDCGIGFAPKKIRWFEIVTGYVVGVGFIVAVSLVATHWIG